jgi:hypothetical protein
MKPDNSPSGSNPSLGTFQECNTPAVVTIIRIREFICSAIRLYLAVGIYLFIILLVVLYMNQIQVL